MYQGNVFSPFFSINFLFLKILAFLAPKTEILAKKGFVWLFLVKIFKNKKLIKKVRKYSLDTRIQMALANFWSFLSKNIFLPLFKKVWGKKSLFWRFLKNTIFSQKSDYLNRFLMKFPFQKCVLLYTLLVFKL